MSKGEETRQRILQRAMELASTVGLEGLSLGQLAAETEMSKSGLFAHFASKEDLQLQILETARETFVADVFLPALRLPRGEPRLRELVRRWLAWEAGSSTTGGCPFVGAAAEYDDRPGPVRDAVAGVLRELIGLLSRAARLGVEEGHFRADLDCDQLAYEMYGTFLAFHFYLRLLGDAAAADRARAAFERLLERARPVH